ncbi:hypothetical protein HYO99_gp33 [Roseobacter phage RD-1410W1-01]|uniref:Uncharacterized protein n=1 Tax=Roseobacter phage RD-1410W1-01 TaxID=1815984 RepID=A0A191VYH2_9CAUD|nr:hypothetical protein HYO99_gp33 [Roseobacter phage RD-1410W1-01]ANJ20767.1 hypothetical protein RDp01_gp33 [Roseobacter phage RD-1410W1-01]
MSKKFRQDEPVQTAEGTGRIAGEIAGGKRAHWRVTLDESGDTVTLPTSEIFKRGETMPEVEAEEVDEGTGDDD